MKTILSTFAITAILAIVTANYTTAEEIGVVTRDRVNVRGQPSVFSEVLTQLHKGDKVIILEEITHAKTKEGDLTNWFKIALPRGVPVYVNALYINTNFMTVIPNRLNIRAGRGEEYSILGRMEKGTPVKVVKSYGDWLEIEPPTNAYAFIATEFVEKKPVIVEEPKPQPATPVTVKSAEETKPAEVTKPAETAKPAEPTKPAEETPKQEPAKEQTPPPQEKKETQPAPGQKPVVLEPTVITTENRPLVKQEAEAKERVLALIQGREPGKPAQVTTNVEVAKQEEPAVPPRIVTREGYVKWTLNIQAPSSYVLETLDTKKVINYLYSTNISLKEFKGKRVLVTGKEAIDKRWPNTPVLTIDTITEVQEEQDATR